MLGLYYQLYQSIRSLRWQTRWRPRFLQHRARCSHVREMASRVISFVLGTVRRVEERVALRRLGRVEVRRHVLERVLRYLAVELPRRQLGRVGKESPRPLD